MKKILTLFIFILLVQGLSSQVTIQEVLLQVKEQAPEHKIKGIIPARTQLEVDNIGHARLPQLGLSGQATYQSDVTFLDVAVPNIEIPVPDNFQYKFQGELSQLIYDGGSINALKEATLISSLAESAQLDMQIEQIRKNAINLYFSVIELEEVKNSLLLKKEDLQARKSSLEAGVENGVILEAELFNLEAALLELEKEVLVTETQRRTILNTLSLLTGNQYSEDVAFQTPQEINELATIPSGLAYYDLLDQKSRGIEVSQKIKDAGSKPKLSAFGQLGVGKPGLNFLDESLSEYYIVGMRMQMQFSNLYSKSNDRQINKLKKEIIENNKKSYDRQWNSEMKQYQNDIARYRENIERNATLLELRASIKNVAQSQLDNGVITSADYIERLNEENIARISLQIAEIRKTKTEYLLQHHTGNYQR